MDPEILARLKAGQELRRRGKLTPQQNAALAELERRYGVAQPKAAPLPVNLGVHAGAVHQPEEPTPRELGARSVEGRTLSPVASLAQGAGSMLFGVGTPITAAEAFVRSNLDRDPENDFSWDESLEFARGRREALEEQNPRSNLAGKAAGLVAGIAATRRLPPAARNVFALQKGQTARNIGRLMAGGSAAAGVTALNEQGAGAVPSNAVFGAAAAPIAAGGLRVAGAGASAVYSRIDPNHAAIRLLAQKSGEAADVLAERFNQFRERTGRPPRLLEILSRDASEQLGRIGRGRTAAGEVFREADEASAAALPDELGARIAMGGPMTTAAAERARLSTGQEVAESLGPRRTTVAEVQRSMRGTVEEAGQEVSRRPTATQAIREQVRDAEFDRVMGQIGHQRVPLVANMLDAVEDPDVLQTLDPALRRRVLDAMQHGAMTGNLPDLSVRAWDAIRQALAQKAGPGAGQIYARLRDKVRDYVSAAVPEYGEALERYGRHSDFLSGMQLGGTVTRASTQEFVDLLRTAGGGLPNAPRSAAGRAAVQEGAQHGVRRTLIDALGDTPEKADRFMRRLATSQGLRRRIRAALSDDEASALEALADQYGYQVRFAEGVTAGSRLVSRGDVETFAQALKLSESPTSGTGVRMGTRGALADALLGGEEQSRRAIERLATDQQYRERILSVLTQTEREKLEQIATRYGRRLRLIEGVEAGQRVTQPGTTQEFQEAVRQASTTPEGQWGAQAGARRALVDAARESPAGASRMAEQIVSNPGFRDRIAAALGSPEAGRLRDVGESFSTARMRMSAAAPHGGSLVDRRAMEQAENLQQWIRAAVIAYGRASGALIANWANVAIQRFRLSENAARRLAEMAVDPENAHVVIAQLRRAGLSAEQITEIYRAAALATGVGVGQE